MVKKNLETPLRDNLSLLEFFIDQGVKSSEFKDIPLVNWIFAGLNAISTIRDVLVLRKVHAFRAGLEGISYRLNPHAGNSFESDHPAAHPRSYVWWDPRKEFQFGLVGHSAENEVKVRRSANSSLNLRFR